MQRLDEPLTRHSLHDPLQSAYRKDHSTETAITKIHHDIITSLDEGRCTVLASLDLSAAFDTVDHDILWHRLSTYYGIRGVALQWFSSYLRDRQTKICINSSYSESRRLKCGVPQGSVLPERYHSSANDLQDTENVTTMKLMLEMPWIVWKSLYQMYVNGLGLTKTKQILLFLVHTQINMNT